MTIATPFLIAFFLGFIVLASLSHRSEKFSINLLKLSYIPFLGIGMISVLVFWLLIAGFLPLEPPLTRNLLRALFLVFGALSCYAAVRIFLPTRFGTIRMSRNKWDWLFVGFLLIALILFLDNLLKIFAGYSDGMWDAWYIWNMHAKFVFLSGENWMRLFSQGLRITHTDYPFLLPGFVYFGWEVIGSFSRMIPSILSFIFMAGTAAILFSTLNIVRDKLMALAAVFFLFIPFQLYYEGASQCADVPIGLYFLFVLSLTAVELADKEKTFQYDVLIGLVLGFCVFTKNEGWSFLLSYTGMRLVYEMIAKKFSARDWLVRLGVFALIAAASLMIKTLAPANDIFGSRELGEIFSKIMDPQRYGLILKYLAEDILAFGNGIIPIFALLLALVVLVGFRKSAKKAEYLLFFGPVILTFAQYVFIYLITPRDLNWHLDTSLMRLIVQLYPSLLFAVFYFLTNPFYPDCDKIKDISLQRGETA